MLASSCSSIDEISNGIDSLGTVMVFFLGWTSLSDVIRSLVMIGNNPLTFAGINRGLLSEYRRAAEEGSFIQFMGKGTSFKELFVPALEFNINGAVSSSKP